AKKIVQDNRDKRKTQTVRLNFIKISLNLSVFFIYWLVFAQPLNDIALDKLSVKEYENPFSDGSFRTR
ncbi:hypothetical protein ACTGUT_10405, partial [Streptococcus suis]